MLCVCVCKKVCVIFQVFFRLCSNHSYCLSVIRTQVTKTLKPVFTIPERKKKEEEKNTNKCVHVEN